MVQVGQKYVLLSATWTVHSDSLDGYFYHYLDHALHTQTKLATPSSTIKCLLRVVVTVFVPLVGDMAAQPVVCCF